MLSPLAVAALVSFAGLASAANVKTNITTLLGEARQAAGRMPSPITTPIAQETVSELQKTLAPYTGVYLGFKFLLESPDSEYKAGETEITIAPEGVSIRQATGTRTVRKHYAYSQLEPAESPNGTADALFFNVKGDDTVTYAVNTKPTTDGDASWGMFVIFRGPHGMTFGGGQLFNRTQIEAGVYEKIVLSALREEERRLKRTVYPRLPTGKRP